MRRSGNLHRGSMIHGFDGARFLLGEEPIEVFAAGSCMVDPETGRAGDIDTAAVVMRTASGTVRHISFSRRATYGHDQRVEVLGSKDMLRTGNIHETTVEHATAQDLVQAPVLNFLLERHAADYKLELDPFIDPPTNGTRPHPAGQDGIAALRLADAAARSREIGLPVGVMQHLYHVGLGNRVLHCDPRRHRPDVDQASQRR